MPDAISTGLGDPLLRWSLIVGLLLGGSFAYPLNRWLLARGRGHAAGHAHRAH